MLRLLTTTRPLCVSLPLSNQLITALYLYIFYLKFKLNFEAFEENLVNF